MVLAQPSMMMMVQPWEAAQGGSWQEEAGGAGWKPDAAPPPGEPPARSEEPECPICRHPFDLERHVPKLLECLHTFCLHCLRQLHLRSASAQAGGAKGGQADSIPCPLCRHLTLLPGGDAQNLLLNTKLAKACARSPADYPQPPLPLETLTPSPVRPLAGHSGTCLPPVMTAREVEVDQPSRSAGKICGLLILCLGCVGAASAAIYFGSIGNFAVLPVLILASVGCFLMVTFITCCSRRAPNTRVPKPQPVGHLCPAAGPHPAPRGSPHLQLALCLHPSLRWPAARAPRLSVPRLAFPRCR